MEKTAGQIIEELEQEIKGNPDRYYGIRDCANIIAIKSGYTLPTIWTEFGTFLNIENPLSVRRQGERPKPETSLLLIKTKCKRKLAKKRSDGSVFAYPVVKNSVVSLELLTPEAGGLTGRELNGIQNSKRETKQTLYDEKQKSEYLEVIEFAKKAGVTVEEVVRIAQLYKSNEYSWTRLESEYGTPN